MRLGLFFLLCVLNVGCAIVRKDKEEPVENGPREEKAEPVLKPSEVLKPESASRKSASPLTDHFWVRGTYFQGDVVTLMRVDSAGSVTPDGTLLSGEEDLGLDDVVNMGRMEFNVRMSERNNLRLDYFKLDRYFMLGAVHDPYRQAVIASLARLARTFGARAVAEGVETEDDLRLVRDLGIDLVQGFLISAPRSPRELESQSLLAEWARQEATPAARR